METVVIYVCTYVCTYIHISRCQPYGAHLANTPQTVDFVILLQGLETFCGERVKGRG
jgi:hypothetical protein